MSRIHSVLVCFAGLIGSASAADQPILGNSLQLKNTGVVTGRKVVVKAKEKASPNTLVGNPVLSGASVTVEASGGTPSSQTFPLPTGISFLTGKPFWTGNATSGFKYKDSKAENGPLKVVKIKRSGSGTFTIKLVATSKLAPITVLPPNPGTSGCATLTLLGGGDVYHMQFANGDGVITNAGSVVYKHKKVVTQGLCPGGSTTTTTTTTGSTSSSTSTTTTMPSCSDGITNGLETDIDCGGGVCPLCGDGSACGSFTDCLSGVCTLGICQAPTCSDLVQNALETDVDCGGGTCPDCGTGQGCNTGTDCVSLVCTLGVCQAATCSDGVQNQGETNIDCGGPCAACSCQVLGSCFMFVTSTSSGGNMGGLAGADATCNARAAAGGIPGVFQAWLCANGTDPAGRSLHATVPYRRTDGAVIANNWSDLTDGSIANAINRDEFGSDQSGNAPFLPWTYVNTAGTCDNETYLSPGSGPCPAFSNCPTNCANDGGGNGWTSSSGFVQGSKGDINATNGNWTDGATGLCSTPQERVYCIQQ